MEQKKEHIEEALDFINRYKGYYRWREDEIQEAFYKFCKYYIPGKGTSPSTYIKMCIDFVIKTSMKNETLHKNKGTKVYFDKTFADGDQRTQIELQMINFNPPAPLPMEIEEDKQEVNNILEFLMKTLTKKERDVITKFYLKGMNMVEIANEHNTLRQTIFERKKYALKKMRKRAKDNNLDISNLF